MLKNENIGKRVRLKSTGEVGIIIYTWESKEILEIDCYIAFFGKSFPQAEPDEKPYVLRYTLSSLEILE